MRAKVLNLSLVTYLLSFAFLAACDQPAGNGKPDGGGEGHSVTIGSAADLQKIGADASFPLNGKYTLSGNVIVSDWTPIGTTSKPFSGRFDGANHKITISSDQGGVFGAIKNATVRNLKVEATANVSASSRYGVHIGGIAGNATSGAIKNCEAAVTFTAAVHGQNSSAGGIVGTMTNNTTVRDCTAAGTITLTSGTVSGDLMVYAGGIAGYSGTGVVGSGVSGCLITASKWNGTVSVTGNYPYGGGITGYNYVGSSVTLCSTAGEVCATGTNLLYAGGISGYNSGGLNQGIATKIENCYSTANVTATSTSKSALVGGIVGANACKDAVISKCYTTGAVSVTVDGSSGANNGESIGPKIAANAGGIAGAQYVGTSPIIEKCAALNTSITGTDSASGAVWNIYRISGEGTDGNNDGLWKTNVANSAMTVTKGDTPHTATPGADAKDGADCAVKPEQSAYEALDWNFSGVWIMSGDYPVLR